MELLCSHRKDIRDLLYSGLPPKSSGKIQIWLKQGKKIGILYKSNVPLCHIFIMQCSLRYGPRPKTLEQLRQTVFSVSYGPRPKKNSSWNGVCSCEVRNKAEENSSAKHSSPKIRRKLKTDNKENAPKCHDLPTVPVLFLSAACIDLLPGKNGTQHVTDGLPYQWNF